jgi:predicted exporter
VKRDNYVKAKKVEAANRGGLASVSTSALRQNVWRRMMMRYAPVISALGNKHGEA